MNNASQVCFELVDVSPSAPQACQTTMREFDINIDRDLPAPEKGRMWGGRCGLIRYEWHDFMVS
jgi:hypothetical protein